MKSLNTKILFVSIAILGLAACGAPGASDTSTEGEAESATGTQSVNELASGDSCRVSKRSPICSEGAMFFREAELYQTAAAVDFPNQVPGHETIKNSCITLNETYVFESCYHNQIAFDLIHDAVGNVDLCIERGSLTPRMSTPIFYNGSYPNGSDLDMPGIALPEKDRVVSRIDTPSCPWGYRLNSYSGLCEKRSQCWLDTPSVAAE